MAAKDFFHEIVKECLIADGWIITHDGYRLATDLLKDALSIDFGAERLITAERGIEKIAVEVKSFLGDSLIYDFHGALGQMLVYQVNLEIQDPERQLFLAVPEPVFVKMSQQRVFEVVLERYTINIFLYDPIQKQIIQWIPQVK